MLYCAAKIDENNVVTDTIVVDDTNIRNNNDNLDDDVCTIFCNQVRQTTGNWKWAGMYQENQDHVRKIEPGIGDNWDPGSNKFYQKKPHDSWVLDSDLNWQPPIPRPNNTTKWIWSEDTSSWELPQQPFEVSANYYNETPEDPDNDNYIGRAED